MYFHSLRAVDSNRIVELLPLIKTSEAARNEMAELHMRLVIKIARSMTNTDVEEYVAQGMLGLILGIRSMAKTKQGTYVSNPTNYLGKAINSTLRRFRNKNQLFPVSSQTLKKGKWRPIVLSTDLSRKNNPNRFVDLTAPAKDLFDELSMCLKTEQDQRVFQLRIAGYKDLEIAEIMDLTQQRISQIRGEIEKRFYARNANSRRVEGRISTATC